MVLRKNRAAVSPRKSSGAWSAQSPTGPPTPLPGYSDLVEIGGGAFATVYSAKEAGTGRRVALKMLKLDTVHGHLLETFQQEIEALAKVSDHPNIVTLYRPLSTPDGRPVLVLELCRASLAERVRTTGPLEPRDVVRVGIKIAGALETAHRNGFLHRDMKPQNILVTQFGEPALADFGVAALQASAQATAGVFGFTTLHAAPEILEGHHLSPATDVYGLASTMYQLLAGAAPFAAFDNEAPASVILRIIRDPVRPLRAEAVPIELSDVLEAALAKDPSGRPATAIDFARSLQAVEVIAGWPQTTYVAWGEASTPPSAGRAVEAPPPRPVPAATPLGSPPPGPVSAATAGSVPAGSAPAASPAPYPEAPAAFPLEPGRRPSPPPPPPPPAPAWVRSGSSSLDPYPSAGGPSLRPPDPGLRQVLAPDPSTRGQPSRPIASPRSPLPPLLPPSISETERGDRPTPSRPVFVDPDVPVTDEPGPKPAWTPAAPAGESVYEQTALPRLGQARPRPAAAHASRPAGGGRSSRLNGTSALGVAAIAIAALVVIAAILLVAGVI